MPLKPKRPKAIWTTAFKDQHKALHPERTETGGVKSRSQSKAVRDAVYRGIAELYKCAHPLCDACQRANKDWTRGHQRWTDDIHHKRGKDGLLYFDVRYFVAVCRPCHQWIDTHREEAAKLGLLDLEAWNKQGV